MGKFTGVWGTFEYLDETTEAIEEVREKGQTPTVISPCPRHEIDHALGHPFTPVPWVSLCFGALGTLIGYSFTAWTASDWVLPVGGKPILAIPAFTILGFELTILMAAVHTLLAVILFGIIGTLMNPLPEGVKRYVRFQRDRFGVVVPCSESQVSKFEEILKNHGAEEVHIEKT